jgi:S-DNA-T family DNA segregation ATPase FtsK/SpoIIIE
MLTTLQFPDDFPDDIDGELLQKAIAICRKEKKRSTSLLQRRLRLGYTRAGVLIDIITENGLDGLPPTDAPLP